MIGSFIDFGFKPSSSEMDITNIDSINNYINKLSNISCIIHLASINLRDSEFDIVKSINVNINGTTNMLNIAMKYNIPFILLSSGAVFSSFNNTDKFNENDITNPNCIYGYTKCSAEKIALLYSKSIIIRTGWVFGNYKKKYYKFVENVINNLLNNKNINASNNFFGSSIYVLDLIEHMKFLILNSKFGIQHVVNDGIVCGYTIAIEIANILNKNIDLIYDVSSSDIPNCGPIRSLSEILDTIYSYNKLKNWKISLKKYILKLKINTNINPNKIWRNRNSCRLCNSYNLKIFFNLVPTPLANHFTKDIIDNQEIIPLDLCICKICNHIQLLQIVDPKCQYLNYFYISSTSTIMTNHLKNSIDEFTKNLLKTDNILEIGSNDGICIKYLLDNNFLNIIGIDPAKNIKERHNLPIICDFFCSNILETLKKKYNTFKLIFAFHCCAHIENINDVFKTIYNLLDDDGIFIMEVGYFYSIFKNKSFDVIYHEHIDYHTCTAMQKFTLNNNLLLFKVKENNIQGGSIQFYISKKESNFKIDDTVYENIKKEKNINLFNISKLINWKNNIIRCGKDINYILNSLVSNKKVIVGYGASAKSTTFLYQYNISKNIIKYIIDDNIYKQNFYSPGLNIPITSIDILNNINVDYIIILSCNFVEEIVKKLEKYNIRIIIPSSEIRII